MIHHQPDLTPRKHKAELKTYLSAQTLCVALQRIRLYHASLAHEASAGSFSVLSPYPTLGGGARDGDDAFLGLHARVGPRSKVAANACVFADALSESLVLGVPGRVSPLLTTA